ncbi:MULTISPECIES: hypothetical protein [unclassified Moorena]|uniref:hypothetical protein n=1 Tax=unclassified Moorena TaxID=2683338 RepID=UPI0013C663AA|nr:MULTISPECIES: hypothetical protein [unclassified Moorena]NEO19283.1 hypothetical protein [Moorena sp. SIO4A5]NEQ58363.1 hypothetical protein [Moorena sp. SIO4A1]
MTEEYQRLEEARNHIIHWKRWGPYLSERQWGTVREDYSPDGQAWDYFTHDQARSRTYRWGEDGILGICDDQQYLCFALALWNGKDPILKERIYGLTGTEGNHGEDVKEYYFYLDSTPTHSYMKGLYKYPQAEFPYTWLVQENQRRGREAPEFELLDTGIFQENRYYDVFLEYAKASAEQILIQITAINRGPDPQTLHILPTLWFRNTWSWNANSPKPLIKVAKSDHQFSVLEASHPTLGQRWFYCEGSPELLVTDNETNYQRLFGVENQSAYVKDGINNYVVQGDNNAVNPSRVGTKVAPHYRFTIGAGETRVIKLWLSDAPNIPQPFGSEFSRIIATRRSEADQFYHAIAPSGLNNDQRNIQRQAFAGLLWSKQYYYYNVETWLKGDPNQPPPPPERLKVRNHQWNHLDNADILSMPDKWEYPWFAAWDLAFHCIPLAVRQKKPHNEHAQHECGMNFAQGLLDHEDEL